MSADRDKFIAFLEGLAPEGETALLVKQVPHRRNGKPQYHGDGTLKTLYPSMLPKDAKPKDGESWYGNTGCFVLDRFKGGKPSAAIANCDFVLVMILDDIGTKSITPRLAPTWIMETSAGNFQWGYAFDLDHQPTKGDYSAAIRAMATAGFTDPGACNPVRNFRIPGSVNIKQDKDDFAAILHEFHPDRRYLLQEILDVHSVVAGEPDTFNPKPVELADDGNDSVLRWLANSQLVLSGVRPSGWADVVCPNHGEHTDGSIVAGYRPSDRVFKCLHGHCVDLDSATFLEWVADNGGPEVKPGLREELLAAVHNETLAKLRPTETFPDAAKEVVAEVERKQMSRIEKNDWYRNFAYILTDDSYFDLNYRREVSRSNFNALFRHIACFSVHGSAAGGKRRIEASVCYDENRDAHGAYILAGVTYSPGDGVILSRNGDVYGNRWTDARPPLGNMPKVEDAEIQRWLDHCEVLIPSESERAHVFDVMAFKVQNASIKINHAILHGGDEGCGKDTLWAPFIWAVAGDNHRNRTIVDNDGLHSQWGYNLEAEICILNELREPEAAQRRALANRLKPIIAAPPDTISINRKGLHPYDMANRLLVLAFTNDPVPISLPSQDRRWFAVWSSAPRMDPVEARGMWHWYKEAGGFQKIAAWLWQRDVSRFNPAAAPAETDFKRTLIEQSMSSTESAVVQLIVSRRGDFAHGIIAGPFHALADRLETPNGGRVFPNTVLHALKEAGWIDLGRVGTTEFPNKRGIWCAPDLAKKYNKSDIRRMLEDIDTHNQKG